MLSNNDIVGFLQGTWNLTPLAGNATAGSGGTSGITMDQGSLDRSIAMQFQIPIGTLTGEHQNRATAEVNYSSFQLDAVEPTAQMIATSFNKYV